MLPPPLPETGTERLLSAYPAPLPLPPPLPYEVQPGPPPPFPMPMPPPPPVVSWDSSEDVREGA